MEVAAEANNAPPPHSQSYEAPEDWGSMSELTELSDLDSDSDSDPADDVNVFLPLMISRSYEIPRSHSLA